MVMSLIEVTDIYIMLKLLIFQNITYVQALKATATSVIGVIRPTAQFCYQMY